MLHARTSTAGSTPPCDTYPKVWEHRKEVQVTPDTVTTLTFVTDTRTLTVSQDTNNGSEVEAVVTSNCGGLGPVTHSFPSSHQRGRGTTTKSTTYQRSVPDPPLHEQQWNEPQTELSESTLRGSPNSPVATLWNKDRNLIWTKEKCFC